MVKNLFIFKKEKKGFTLIELLAVIVILGIIMALIIPEVIKTIEKSQIKSLENSVRGLMRAVDIAQKENAFEDGLRAITFTYENGNEISDVGGLKLDYTGKRLQDGKIEIDVDGKIALAFYDGKYCIEKDYESDDISITKTLLDDCDLDILTYYTDASGANRPVLLTGMTPIKWNSFTEVTTTEDDEDWYDYQNQKWANAKTADGSYWVWIPRYAYKIKKGFHQTISDPEIDIKFLNGTTNNPIDSTVIETDGYDGSENGKNTNNNYFLHLAFDFSDSGKDNPIEGFWVAKFEPSVADQTDPCFISPSVNNCNKTTLTPKIIPNVNSWRNIQLGNMYTVSQNMKNYICNGPCDDGTDTHMMKNIEWGAVAYLSRSQYGNQQEMWNNAYFASSKYKTGCAGSKVDAINEDICVEWDTNGGVKASTTGNVYGIYDMKGGAYEYVMGNYNLVSYNSGFSNPVGIDPKYIDVYSMGTSDTAQQNYEATQDRYGDAIWETSLGGTGSTSWHGAHSTFIISYGPWLSRGGGAGISYAGVFYFNNGGGGGYNNHSFRPVALR